MNNCNEIIITKDYVKPLVYFIMSMFQQENGHLQGTSSKSDLLGGYIDRWINKLSENLIFNNYLLKDRDYRAVIDYFIYGPESTKNAPDILGLKCLNVILPYNDIVKFAEFDEDTWKMCEGMPHIEVKTFKRNQKLVAIREAQMDDDTYYVFAESNIAPDYITSLLSFESINAGLLDEIKMDETFIKNNSKNILMQPVVVNQVSGNNIGTLKLLSIIKGSDYKQNSLLCDNGEKPYYLKEVTMVDKIPKLKSYEEKTPKELLNCTLARYIEINDNKWEGEKLIPFQMDKPESIIVKVINKRSAYIECTADCLLSSYQLEKDKLYRLSIDVFDRNSKWNEYITYKNQLITNLDRTNELVNLFDEIVLKFSKDREKNHHDTIVKLCNQINELSNK